MSLSPPPNIRSPLADARGFCTVLWYKWFNDLPQGPGFSGTITTAALTGGGATGSMTFVNGVLTSQVAAT